MAAGRPTEYSEEKLTKAREYILECEDYDSETGPEERPTIKLKVRLPTKGGLANHLDVSRETLYAWAETYPEFSDIMETLGAKQEDRLINNGLSGDYNPTIAKVLLTKHGYRDAVDTDVTSKGEQINITDPKVIALAQEYEKKLKEGL